MAPPPRVRSAPDQPGLSVSRFVLLAVGLYMLFSGRFGLDGRASGWGLLMMLEAGVPVLIGLFMLRGALAPFADQEYARRKAWPSATVRRRVGFREGLPTRVAHLGRRATARMGDRAMRSGAVSYRAHGTRQSTDTESDGGFGNVGVAE